MNSAFELKSLPAAEPNLVFGSVVQMERDEHDEDEDSEDGDDNSFQTFEDECISVTEFLEDNKHELQHNIIDMASPHTPHRWSPSLSRAFRDRYCNRSKLRTPRTMTRLMQQHRDNERHRHRGLNASIKDITRQIPGYEAAAKETKIVKLQRIIHYICHLEGHIQGLCQELAVGLQYKNLFLSPHIPKRNEPKRPKIITGPSPGKRSKPKVPKVTSRFHHVSSSTDLPTKTALPASLTKKGENRYAGRRLKVSSPTIDSTTDDDRMSDVATKASVPAPSNTHELNQQLQTMKLKPDPDFDGMSKASMSGLSKDAVLTDAWELLSDTSEPAPVDHDENDDTWVEDDSGGLPFHAYDDLLTVFPPDMNFDSPPGKMPFSGIGRTADDGALPGTYMSASNSQSSEWATPSSVSSCRFTAVTNYSSKKTKNVVPSSAVVDEDTEPFAVMWGDEHKDSKAKCKDNVQKKKAFVKCSPVASTSNVLTKQKLNFRGLSSNSHSEAPKNDICKPKGTESGPTDLRKTSWMNGFMMFSQMHRKDYIESHPGTPTSHISKIMGQDWRQLSNTEQNVYREYARSYSLKFLQA